MYVILKVTYHKATEGHMAKISKMMGTKIILLTATLIISILFVSSVFLFRSPLGNSSTSTPSPPEWFMDWLQAPVCLPPCWQGITPGITSITDTVKLLKEIPWITITYGPKSDYPKRNRLEIWWQSNPPSRVVGQAYSDDQGNITTSISFNGILSTALKDVVTAYGVPNYVFIPDCQDGRCRTQLVYITSGTMIDLGILKPNWRGFVTISSDTKIRGIEFFPPGEEGFIDAHPAYSNRITRKFSSWEGYSKYPFR